MPDLSAALCEHGNTGPARIEWADAGWYQLPTDNYGFADRGTDEHVERIKNPGSIVGRNWPNHSTRDYDVLDEWGFLYPWGGIALDCGASGVVTFDFDGDCLDTIADDGRPDIAAALRTADGRQYTRRNSERGHYPFLLRRNTDGTLAELFGDTAGAFTVYGEVRCHHGVVIGAPTRHTSADDGGHYTVVPGPITPLPDVLRNCLGWNGRADTAPTITDAELDGFLKDHDRYGNTMLLRWVVGRFHEYVERGSSRHRALIACLTWSFEEARCGFYPAAMALYELAEAFNARFGDGVGRARITPDNGEVLSAAKWALGSAMQVDPARRIEKLRKRKAK